MRGMGYAREMRRKHIKRKKRIVHEQRDYFYYEHEGYLSKNKIHCSCGMCRYYRKTNNKGHRRAIPGNYSPSRNWSHSDKQKLNRMETDLDEYLEETKT